MEGVSSFAGLQEEYPLGFSHQIVLACLYVVASKLRWQKSFTGGQEVEENFRSHWQM